MNKIEQAFDIVISQADHINGTPMVAVSDFVAAVDLATEMERHMLELMLFATHPKTCAAYAAYVDHPDFPDYPGMKVLGAGPCNCGLDDKFKLLNELFGTDLKANIPEQ